MFSLLNRIGEQALFAFDPETAHSLSITALKTGLPLADPDACVGWVFQSRPFRKPANRGRRQSSGTSWLPGAPAA